MVSRVWIVDDAGDSVILHWCGCDAIEWEERNKVDDGCQDPRALSDRHLKPRVEASRPFLEA